MFHKSEMSPMIRSSGTNFDSLVYLNPRLGCIHLKCLYSVISVKINLLPASTTNVKMDLYVDGQSVVSASWAVSCYLCVAGSISLSSHSVLQCFAVCCSVLQFAAVCCNVL